MAKYVGLAMLALLLAGLGYYEYDQAKTQRLHGYGQVVDGIYSKVITSFKAMSVVESDETRIEGKVMVRSVSTDKADLLIAACQRAHEELTKTRDEFTKIVPPEEARELHDQVLQLIDGTIRLAKSNQSNFALHKKAQQGAQVSPDLVRSVMEKARAEAREVARLRGEVREKKDALLAL